MSIRHLILAGLLAGTSAAQAAPIFTDNFDADGLALNQTSFLSGWTVSGGTVDLIGAVGFWDLMPGSGRYVDLDGSSDKAGVLTKSWNLLAGVTYGASFYLAGNHRNAGDDHVEVNFGSSVASVVLGQDDGFGLSSMLFTPDADGKYSLSFVDFGSDKMGALLDNVSLEIIAPRQRLLAEINQVPEPSTGVLVLAGLAGAGFAARRRRMR